MDSTLGPPQVDTFVGFYEKSLLCSPEKPAYFRYVDYIFCLFNNIEAGLFFPSLNSV